MIYFVYANRAEKSLLEPIIRATRERKRAYKELDLSALIKNIHLDKNLSKIYDCAYAEVDYNNIDFVVVIGDRREIMFACLAFFIRGVKIYQLAAGDLSGKITLVDDYFRHLITIMTSKQVCFSDKSKKRADDLLEILGLPVNSAMYPNPSLSDINIDNASTSIFESYDLILMHPQSLSRAATLSDMHEVRRLIDLNKRCVIIRGNKDLHFEIFYDLWNKLQQEGRVSIFNNVEKTEFISLLKNCERFITNSSCSFYEAPFFLKEEQIIRVGNRNKGREVVKYTADDLKSNNRILDFLEGYSKGE